MIDNMADVIIGATPPQNGQPIRRDPVNQVAVLTFLEEIKPYTYDAQGRVTGGEIDPIVYKWLTSFVSKIASLSNKDEDDAYMSYLQIESMIIDAYELLPGFDDPHQAGYLFMVVENARKYAYDTLTRSMDATERKLLQTSIHAAISNSNLTTMEGQIKQGGKLSSLGKIRKLFEF